MSKSRHFASFWRLTLFEKVICFNVLMLLGEAAAGLWVTSHNLESHHYLIDTGFIVAATVLSLLINIMLLRASFRPLFSLLQTIRLVSAGKTEARSEHLSADTEIGELAMAFNGMLDRLENMRREQALLILQAQEEERRRIALELHDESSQNLTALLVHAEILQQTCRALPDEAMLPEVRARINSGLDELTRLSQHTLESIRTLALQLRPGVLDDLGLHAALRWLIEDSRQRLHLNVELHLKPGEATANAKTSYPSLYETTLFRVAQEGLTNVARHAQATHVTLELQQSRRHIALRIQDNGQGYSAARQSTGLGITGMRERVAMLNGTLNLCSEPGQGTTLIATLPLPASAPNNGMEKLHA